MISNRRRRGFTLIEVIIVLAVVGVLVGIIVPMVRTYIVQAKIQRAEQDTKSLGEAILAFNKDTARFPIYQSGVAVSPADPVFDVLTTADGDTPEAGVDASSWLSAISDTFENQLKKNTPGGNGAAYPTTGEFAWRGPYIGSIKKDPWGNRYVCNASRLRPDINEAAWVLSAGPNETIETVFSQKRSSLVIGGDDIAYRIK